MRSGRQPVPQASHDFARTNLQQPKGLQPFQSACSLVGICPNASMIFAGEAPTGCDGNQSRSTAKRRFHMPAAIAAWMAVIKQNKQCKIVDKQNKQQTLQHGQKHHLHFQISNPQMRGSIAANNSKAPQLCTSQRDCNHSEACFLWLASVQMCP